MRWLYGFFALAVVLGLAFWWLLLDARAPSSAEKIFDVAQYRTLTQDNWQDGPRDLRIAVIGKDVAPGFAAEPGAFGSDYIVAYTAFQLVWSDSGTAGPIVVGGAIDAATALEMQQSPGQASFNQVAYDRLLSAMTQASQVFITHEHVDHVMAIARHPAPEQLALKLRLNTWQLSAMPSFAIGGKLANAIAQSETTAFAEPELVAPGVVRIPTPGHTAGSQCFYIRMKDGREALLIGDIVWTMSNIDNLTTRPRLLQYALFDPEEDREQVLAQVRALHDLRATNPEVTLIPSHDLKYLETLIDARLLTAGFVLSQR